MTTGRIIAIVGAESTGKTRLAGELASALAMHTGLSAVCVPEFLREWCDTMGRTPRADEQFAIAREQQARIDAAAATHGVVVADTTAMMTAVYSRLLFADESLRDFAVAQQQRCTLTLLTSLDLPWEADGLQRDGPHVRAPVDALVRTWLIEGALEWSVVSGHGPARLQSALDAVAPRVRAASTPGRGLFTRLAERNAQPQARTWICETCDLPECEHALWRRRAAD
jgi:nicotinamide riboside kinase